MTFVQFCVGMVITAIIFVFTGSWGYLTVKEKWPDVAWIVACFGFGVCLTILLYQNGVII